MGDIIRLLPDSVANQIAAGEVIQRPASAVKELLENSVDAGASKIQLIIEDAGKVLIQVIDNGKGMSENDARMCFERHATSKIETADQLFAINTKGFRGEAMASIAAVAQVEMKTRTEDNPIGVQINIAGSKIQKQEACQTPVGTSTSVKNLFFNVPARRNFLKSNQVEMRHIMDEFIRVALPHTNIEMSLHHDGDEIFHLKAGKLRQRIVELFGKGFNEKLVPISEETSIAKISGFVGKPDFARKKRGEQFFFVNDRFIKSGYLNHAIASAYDDLLQEKMHPAYFVFFEVNPSFIDINIHPTKTEIKFEDEKSVYAILRSATRQSLGKYNISPTLDFDQEMSITFPPPPKNVTMFQPELPVKQSGSVSAKGAHSAAMVNSRTEGWAAKPEDDWQKLYEGLQSQPQETTTVQSSMSVGGTEKKRTVQLHGRYILSTVKSGAIIIDQKRAHQRVIYEQIIRSLAMQQIPKQQQLFPINLELNSADSKTLSGILDELKLFGIDIEPFGKNAFVIQGLATFIDENSVRDVIDEILEEYNSSGNLKGSKRQEKLAQAMARKAAIPYGKMLQEEEMTQLIDELFACDLPYTAPNGKPTLITLGLDELEKRFG
ncbi:MAG: DNA mismatch repair endonuclease MutL [Flavobacteriales bacterium]|nr:DNA mismatch repair endonuclease MutL [Flavobacteriales bacterium]MCB9192332.1 DNA mismatch repair endonuclease MutL [Flavobacteriales bacterium]MCB9203726.1 DNA mismatch repair endonuclease MutL [Flavobacteriales bacterium]